MQLFSKNGINDVIKNAKPVDKTPVNLEKGTRDKLKTYEKYYLGRVSDKIRDRFALLKEKCN